MANVQHQIPGRRVRVTPEQPDAVDVLEYVKAMIETYGWLQFQSGSVTPSSEENGFTLHDAIGEACNRLQTSVGSRVGHGGKNWPVTTPSGASDLRVEATRLVAENLPAGPTNDQAFNDQASGVEEVFAVIDAAIEQGRKENGI